jgi:hypothetical protein
LERNLLRLREDAQPRDQWCDPTDSAAYFLSLVESPLNGHAGVIIFSYFSSKLQALVGTAIAAVVTMLAYVAMRVGRLGRHPAIARTSATLIISAILIWLRGDWFMGPHWRHLDAQLIRGRVYYLARYQSLDANFGLYECDRFGIYCQSVYYSGDYAPGSGARLSYDGMQNRLSIEC